MKRIENISIDTKMEEIKFHLLLQEVLHRRKEEEVY
jgi:hypothetical protein